MIKVLSIGNSFSEDAQRYLHSIAKADGVDIRNVNLFIGGCSMSRHYRNMLSGGEAYDLQVNGEPTGFQVSLEKALLSQEWDYITLQQASHFSFDYETYQPYLTELAAYVRRCCPKAKLLIHETWSYEEGSERLKNTGYEQAEEMYEDLHKAYEMAAKDIGADGVIPSGTLMRDILSAGVPKVHRDTFHASYGLGRYALGLLWYRVLTGNDVKDNMFCTFDEIVTEQEIALVKKCVRKYKIV